MGYQSSAHGDFLLLSAGKLVWVGILFIRYSQNLKYLVYLFFRNFPAVH